MTSPAAVCTRQFRALRSTSVLALIAALAVAACDSTSEGPTGTPTASGVGILSGSAQAMVFGSALPAPLVVHVTDQYGNGISGVQVTFTTSGGAAVASSTATTDTSGNAQTTATLGGTVGLDTVTASVAGAVTPARFFETALAGAPATITIVSGNGQSGPNSVMLPLPLVVLVADAQGNPASRDSVTWAASAGTLGIPVSVTGFTGNAQNTFSPSIGTDTVTATVNGTVLSTIFVVTGN